MSSSTNALSTYFYNHIMKLSTASPFVVAVIGSGGKTSLIELITSAFLKSSKRILIITTTHMALPMNHPYPCKTHIVGKDEVEIGEEELKHQALLVASIDGDRLMAIHPSLIETLLPHYDIILVEADGARKKNLKYHRNNEPVLLEGTNLLIKVIGLSSLGNRVEEELHNVDLFNRENEWKETMVDNELIHYLACSPRGLKIGKEHHHSIILFNQSDALEGAQLASFIRSCSPYVEKVTYPHLVGSIHTDTIELIYE